jgi:CubicO group peptidase (beta-lactamase class C family)
MTLPLRSLLALACSLPAFASHPLPRSTPAAEGVSSAGLQAFISAADKEVDTMHSFMLLRHGKVVAEAWWQPESPDKPHVLFSLSKSFTSTAIGLAVAEGKLSIDDPVLKLLPGNTPANASDHLKAMRVRDLLTMSTGHASEPKLSSDVPWTDSFFAHPVPHAPGTHFLYNSSATYLCSAIISHLTGQSLLDYLKPRLFTPLGIENPEWSTSPQNISAGGWGLFLRTEDIAKFGQLYLQKGNWLGKQLIPASWVDQATSKQVPNGDKPDSDWAQGYGFQFWRCRHDAYRGDGAFGQFCIVLPQQDAVVVLTADTKDMQHELNLVWTHLLPAFKDAPLPPSPDDDAALRKLCASLKVNPAHVPNTIQLPGSTPKAKSP